MISGINIWFQKNWMLTLSFFLTLAIFFYALPHSIHDFANYYFGAEVLLTKHSLDIYDPWEFNLYIHQQGIDEVYANYSPHSPLARYLFLPFLIFKVSHAKILFNLGGLLFFFWSIHKLAIHLNLKPFFLLLIPLVFFTSLHTGFQYGQAYLWLTGMLIQVYLAFEDHKSWKAAIFLFLAIALKFTPLVLLLFILIKKKYGIVLKTISFLMILITVDFLISGPSHWSIFISEILPRSSDGLINATFSEHHRSFQALLKKLFIYDAEYIPLPFMDAPYLYSFLSAFFIIFLLFSALLLTKVQEPLFSFSFWLILIYAIPSVGSHYSGILLILPYLSIPIFFKKFSTRFLAIMAVFYLSSNRLDYWFPTFALEAFAGVLILFILFFLHLKRKILVQASIFASMLSLPFALKIFPPVSGKSMIEKNNTLIYNRIYISDNELFAETFGTDGFRKKKLNNLRPGQKVKSYNAQELSDLLQKKDVGNVKQGLLLNDSILYFLSDQRHGYHFYQLRKLRCESCL